MRVGRKIQLLVVSIIFVLMAGLFCFWEEYKTRDNATHLLLIAENQYTLNSNFQYHFKKLDEQKEKLTLNQISLSYQKIVNNTKLLESGGIYYLGQTQKEIVPVYYQEVQQDIQTLGMLSFSEIQKIQKLLDKDTLELTSYHQNALLESNLMLKKMSERIEENYYSLYSKRMKIINQGLVSSLILLLILIIVLYSVIYNKVLKPNYALKKAFSSTSYENNIITITSNTLFKEIGNYVTNLQDELKISTKFIDEIGKGNFEISLNENGYLATALRKMQVTLKESSQKEYRTAWTSKGLADLSEKIRNNTNNLEELSRTVLRMIIDYLKCQQGVLYVKKQDRDTHEYFFELINHYGLSKTEYEKTRVGNGEGLLGEILTNPRLMVITDLPDNYTIMSGLGEAKPNCLVILPLITNQSDLVGVLEIASFKNLESYEISLLEQMGESIAVSLASVLNTFHTEQLLIESQDLTKRLKNQEEYMRNNMQALQTAQEEMVRNQVELEGVFKSIDQTLGTIEVDTEGKVISMNQMILDILSFQREDVMGKKIHSFFTQHENEIEEKFDVSWNKLLKDKSITGDFKWINKQQQFIWLNLTLTPVKNQLGQIFKIIVLGKDITKRKEEELEIQRLSLVADTTDSAVMIVNRYGLIEYINTGFTKMTGYSEKEVESEKPEQFLYGEKTDKKSILQIYKKLKSEISFVEQILMYRKDGSMYWASVSVNPVFNQKNTLEKHIFLLVDITDTKTSELDYSYKMNAISHSNAMLEIDLKGNIIMSNQNFLHIFGYDEGELMNLPYLQLIKKEHQKKYTDLLKVLNKGEFISDSYPRLHKTGKELWIKEVYNPIFDLDGQLIKIIVFVTDVTQEKMLEIISAEKDLELKEHSKAINKTIASVEFDMNGKILGANDIFLGVFGYSLDELIGKDQSILLLETDKNKPQNELMWENLRAGKFFEGEFQNIGQNQQPIWLKGTYNPIFNREGHVYKVKMLAQFTTDDKEREINLNSIVQAVKDTFLYLELNEDLTIKSANNLFLDFIQYKRMELRKLAIGSLIKNFTSEDYQELVNVLLIDGQSIEKDFIFQTKSKTQKNFHCSMHPIKNLQNQINKIVVFLV